MQGGPSQLDMTGGPVSKALGSGLTQPTLGLVGPRVGAGMCIFKVYSGKL